MKKQRRSSELQQTDRQTAPRQNPTVKILMMLAAGLSFGRRSPRLSCLPHDQYEHGQLGGWGSFWECGCGRFLRVLSSEETFQGKVDELCRELGDRGRAAARPWRLWAPPTLPRRAGAGAGAGSHRERERGSCVACNLGGCEGRAVHNIHLRSMKIPVKALRVSLRQSSHT
jgi:hypothetical protein